jgi:thiamine biosynthesis lipoprotein
LLRNLFLSALILLICQYSRAQQQRFSFTASKMGSPFTIILFADDSVTAKSLAAHCFALTDSLVAMLSDYIDSSELNRLCARAGSGEWFSCSSVLYEIMEQSKFAYEKSAGSFDISLGPLTRLWRKARKENRFPAAGEIKEKKAITGFNKIQFDPAKHAVRLLQTGMQLDLGGIGQGYIAQKVIDYLKDQQIQNALADVSGDIVCIGTPPGKKGWTVAVNIPENEHDLLPQQLLISNLSVTTSGDLFQYIEHGGRRYSHIVDPATGYGVTSQKNVTVIAADGTTADWLTKACTILSIKQAKRLAENLHAAVLITTIKQGKLVYYTSRGFADYWSRK